MRISLAAPSRGRLRAIATLAVAALLAGCGGGGSTSVPQPPAASGAPATPSAPLRSDSAVTVNFVWPAQLATASGARRRPNYVPPTVHSLAIAISSVAQTTYVNAPAPSAVPTNTSTTIAVPPGTATFTIGEYDGASGAGNLLGSAYKQQATVVAGASNVLKFTLSGNLRQIAIQSLPSPFVEGVAPNATLASTAVATLVGNLGQAFCALPQDADGNTIINMPTETTPGAIPALSIASANAMVAVTSAPAATAACSNQFSIAAPAPTTANVAITVSGTGLANDGVTTMPVTASFNANAIAAFYLADYIDQKILVYDETGKALDLTKLPASSFGGPATPFAGLTNPMGIAYVPPTVAGASGELLFTETSNYGAPYVLEYDELGNARTLATTAFPPGQSTTLPPPGTPLRAAPNVPGGVAEPLFATYAAINGGEFILPNYLNSTITTTDLGGNVTTPAGASATPPTRFSMLGAPVGVIYDANAASIYATNNQLATITRYGTDGTPNATLASATTGIHPMGLAYDPNTKQIYVATAGSQLVATSPTMTNNGSSSGVSVFSEALAPVTNGTGDFTAAGANSGTNTGAGTASFFTSITFDPYTKQFYVSDAGRNAIQVFTEVGAAGTAAGGFPNANDPMFMQLVP